MCRMLPCNMSSSTGEAVLYDDINCYRLFPKIGYWLTSIDYLITSFSFHSRMKLVRTSRLLVTSRLASLLFLTVNSGGGRKNTLIMRPVSFVWQYEINERVYYFGCIMWLHEKTHCIPMVPYGRRIVWFPVGKLYSKNVGARSEIYQVFVWWLIHSVTVTTTIASRNLKQVLCLS